ncbi:MAG: hypothetical protein D3925_20290, partial [Candidatus Electrothrix sp. AR5]|nr:hypothetical protein [Candidatus Electrothrix sp. AR5]
TLVAGGSYADALLKLEGGSILGKTNGCVPPSSTPDNNDWIIDCESQKLVNPLILEAIGYMNELL